jgi:SAM-dependent methyltransferase
MPNVDFARGCAMNAPLWADLNRRLAFDRPELARYVAPFPPTELMQNVSGLTVDRDFAAHGAHFWDVFSLLLPRPVSSYSPVLDFGCGCGRLARMFKGHPGEVHGCDIDKRHVEWVRDNLDFVRALHTQPNQPVAYRDATFDLVIAISVFTHLDEATQDLLLSEMARIVRPGGTLLLTTHGERALQRAVDEESIYRMLSVDSAGFADAQRTFDAGRLAFIPQRGHLTTDKFTYGITFTPDRYVHEHWGCWFKVDKIASGAIHSFQDVIVLTR